MKPFDAIYDGDVTRAYYAVDVRNVLWAAIAKLQITTKYPPQGDVEDTLVNEVIKDLLSAMGYTMTNGLNIEDMNDET